MGGQPIDTSKSQRPDTTVQPTVDPPTAGRGARGTAAAPGTAIAHQLPVKLEPPAPGRFALVPRALRVLTLPALKLPNIPTRPFVLMLEIVLGSFALLLLLLVAVHVRLLQGPIAVDFLARPIQEAINREIEPFKVEVGGAVIRYEDGVGDVHFRLLDIALIGEDGVVVAVAPSAGIGLSGTALVSGRIAPSRIDLIAPALQLYSSPETGLSLSAGVSEQSTVDAVLAPTTQAAAKSLAAEVTGKGAKPEILARPASISIAKAVAEALADARRHTTVSSYLTTLGLVDARIVLLEDGRRSRFNLPALNVSLDHRQKKSYINGEGTVASQGNSFHFNFQAKESEKQRQLALTVGFEELVPSELARELPQFPALSLLGMPASGTASISISHAGELLDLSASLQLTKGPLMLAGLNVAPIDIDAGALSFRYSKQDGRIEFLPSSIVTGSSRATIAGMAKPRIDAKGQNVWDYEMIAGDTAIGDDSLGLSPRAIDEWVATGTVTPAEGMVTLSHMHLDTGPTHVEMAGQWSSEAGLSLAGTLRGMPVDVFKRLWPVFLAADARDWVVHNVGAGEINGGRFRFTLTPSEIRKATAGSSLPDSAISAEFRANGLDIAYMPGLPPVQTGQALMKLTAGQFRLESPNSQVHLPSGKRLDLTNTVFSVGSILSERPDAGVMFDVAGSADAAMELLDSPPLGYAREAGLKPGDLTGNARGNFEIRFPLLANVPAAEVSITGKARISELKASASFGHAKIQGGTIDITVGDKAVEAKGDVLLNGVAATLDWVRLRGVDKALQAPLRLSAVLDSSDREQLGLSVDHLLRGDLPVTVGIVSDGSGVQGADVTVDLTRAELVLENMAWRKAPGQPAQLNFRMVPHQGGGATLKNFRIVGQDIAIEGEAEVSAENRIVAFHFPDFSFNVITHLEVTGKLRADNVWDVVARGPTYDGRQLFRSLFSAGKLTDKSLPASKFGAGIDLKADLGAIVGFSDASLRNVTVSMKRRDGKFTALDARGALASGKPLTVTLEQKPGGRRYLIAQTQDAGEAFRLVGFYGNAEGGQASLKVDLDGEDGVQRSGVLVTQNFAILGDPVVKQVLAKGPTSDTKFVSTAQRLRVNFERMRIPFTAGNGQLVIYDSFINGPELGATLRGKVDFGRQQVELGGTYVPLYGLNCILSDVLPPLSILFSGRSGECLFGITFAIQGGLQNPQVSVNPISALAPGVFRQIFDFIPGSTQITAPATIEPPAPPSQASSMAPMTAADAVASVGDALPPETAAPPLPKSKATGKAKQQYSGDWIAKTEK